MRAIRKIESHTAINIGLAEGYSVKEVLQMILELNRYTNARVTFNASKPTMILIRLIDTIKAKTVLGFETQTNLQ